MEGPPDLTQTSSTGAGAEREVKRHSKLDECNCFSFVQRTGKREENATRLGASTLRYTGTSPRSDIIFLCVDCCDTRLRKLWCEEIKDLDTKEWKLLPDTTTIDLGSSMLPVAAFTASCLRGAGSPEEEYAKQFALKTWPE
jgi:hypothetical protein